MINIAGNFGVVHKGVLKTGGNAVSVAVKAMEIYGMKLCAKVYIISLYVKGRRF